MNNSTSSAQPIKRVPMPGFKYADPVNNPYEYDVANFVDFSGSISQLNEVHRPHVQHLRYANYLKSPVWKVRREIYIEHYGGICQDCEKKRNPLQLHHVTYQRLGVEALGDVVLVCKICHHKIEVAKYQESYQ